MNDKSNFYQIILCAAAWILTAFASSFGYSFLSSTSWSFAARFLVGCLLLWAPITVGLLIMQLYRKKKE